MSHLTTHTDHDTTDCTVWGRPVHYELLTACGRWEGEHRPRDGTGPARTGCMDGGGGVDGAKADANLFDVSSVADAAETHICRSLVPIGDSSGWEWHVLCKGRASQGARDLLQYYAKSGHDRFLPHPVPFITRYHSTSRSNNYSDRVTN